MRTTCAVAIGLAILGLAPSARSDESAQDYVRRMAEAGRPEMAESQARDVLDVDLSEPLSKAVVAAMRAKRGDAEGAIASIATAVVFGSDEPFVRRTAGQILAWHDTRSGSMADDIEASLETMRRAVAETSECAEAYERARDAYVAARAAKPVMPDAGATLVPDSVEAEFAGDADSDAVIFASAAATCGVWSNYVTPSCRDAWCSAIVRACSERVCDAERRGTRFIAHRASWGSYGASRASFGRPGGAWSTPLGTFSSSSRRSAYSAPAASCVPNCVSPPSCESNEGGRRR